jgi:hypothetical protein
VSRFLSSPRRRRRLAWTVLPLSFLAVAIAIVALVSDPKRLPADELRSAPAVREEREVRLTPATRRAINATLDEFVPAAIGRRDPARAWELAGEGLRAGTKRSDWLKGDLPVHPYPFGDRPFRAWRKAYAYRDKVAIDLLLHPRRGARVGSIVFGIDLVRRDRRWLVDSIYPAAVWRAPETQAAQDATASAGTRQQTDQPTRFDEARLDPIWLLVPVLVIGAALLIPLAFGVIGLVDRRRLRRHRASLPRLPASVARRQDQD